MSGLVFLLVALALSILGSLLLWMRHRRPSSVEDAVAEFGKEMRALSPERPQGIGERRNETGR